MRLAKEHSLHSLTRSGQVGPLPGQTTHSGFSLDKSTARHTSLLSGGRAGPVSRQQGVHLVLVSALYSPGPGFEIQ